MPKSNTVIYNHDTDAVIVGSYKPSKGKTAHSRMSNASGPDSNVIRGGASDNIIGGSIKSDGSISWNSETINRANPEVGTCNAGDTEMARRAEELIRDNDVYTVKEWHKSAPNYW